MTNAPILVASAGWSYPDWENIVYPPGKASERLRTVARYLDAVEIDSSFYHPPAAHVTKAWLRAVHDQPRFRFLAKAWQRFTHERSSPWTKAEFEVFTTGLQPLREGGRLDSVLFQFPWSFRNDAGNHDWLRGLISWCPVPQVRARSLGANLGFCRNERGPARMPAPHKLETSN